MSPALASGFLTTEPPGKSLYEFLKYPLFSLARPQSKNHDDGRTESGCFHPSLVAGHPGAQESAARGSQSVDHSMLVETEAGEAAREEAADVPRILRAARMGSCQATILVPHVVHPPSLLPFAPCCPHHSGLLALA